MSDTVKYEWRYFVSIKFTIDKPIFLQLAEIIKANIISGELKPNEKLPSVRELALFYAINPNTVQKALQILEADGLIYTDRTNGKYVSDSMNIFELEKNKIIKHEIGVFVDKLKALGLNIEEIKKLMNNIGDDE